ncbi:DNA-binding response regulator [Umezawaea beigongshangensis]|uniref:DNA-binding response regulator n=1 Tax=Umezawaea beigongshangensis TaxID=2780383 RepID=UPI0018F1E1D9|nr:DNA-binding response regulator [Umezawaea beigongshangensis]
MHQVDQIVVVRGERELHERAGHLFGTAREEIACIANSLFTWQATHPSGPLGASAPVPKRKVFRRSAMLDPSWAQHARAMADNGAEVRITSHEANETVLLDRRLAILAGDVVDGVRSFTVVTSPDLVRGIASLFEVAWRAAVELDAHDRQMAELRPLAPRIISALNAGWKDETAARALGLSLRTYRRRVAELMEALGATSRFQAGARAKDLGLV